MTIFGTRPEAIKMAPVVKQLAADDDDDDETEPVVVVTGQHREMLKQVLDFFKIQPDYDLTIMTKNQRLDQITSRVLLGLDPILEQERPAWPVSTTRYRLAMSRPACGPGTLHHRFLRRLIGR